MTATDKKLKVYEGQVPFNLIEASKLKVTDDFMKYADVFGKVKKVRDRLIKILNSTNVHDFYVQGVDPSMNEDGTGIQFVAGKMPAVGHSYVWGRKAVFNYAPHMDCRIGTPTEWLLFCGVLIKTLVEKKICSVDDAWHMVCCNSAKLGNYNMGKPKILPTGSMEIVGFADLANTCKWLTEAGKIYTASGAYCHKSDCACVSEVYHFYLPYEEDNVTVPWVVIPARR